MDLIKAPTKIEHSIYRAEFRYSPAPGIKGIGEFEEKEIQERVTGDIMEVGEPVHWNLRELCKRKEIKLPVETKMLFDEFDFWLIQSAFSFMPAHDNQFHWARIVAKMESLSKDTKNPITHDAYPRDIYEEKKEKKRIRIGLSLKFAEILEQKVEYVQEIELMRLVPIISLAGIGKSQPTWDFSDRAAFNLKDVNTLYIIIKTPFQSDGIKVSFFSYAQIHTKWGGIVPTVAKKLEGNDTYEIKFSRKFLRQ